MISTDGRGLSAIDAKSRAQEIAFAPFAFQATVVSRDVGLLAAVEASGTTGTTIDELEPSTGLSAYAVSVLLDFGTNLGLVDKRGERFFLGPVGRFVLYDEMTRVNMDFTRDVCYHALPYLEQSLREGRPAGLETLGDWSTIYNGLTRLPPPAGESWFRFDQFYSDKAFDALLPIVFANPVRELLDIGANTGRWALKCAAYDPHVRIRLVDLPRQLEVARHNIANAGFAERVEYTPIDLREDVLPSSLEADAIFMSQFLDCFPEDEIVGILRRVARAMNKGARLYILELFPDRQAYGAARFSLDATSLYFTCLANGNSRMYHAEHMLALVREAGLKIEREQDGVGLGHTLLCCRVN